MKLRITISIAIGLALVLISVISVGPITQESYAALNPSSTSPASGATTGAGSAGQSGSNDGGVVRHLFCDTGVITPICK